MSESDEVGTSLLALGAGVGSKVEQIKVKSANLRGQIASELEQDISHFSEDQIQLIKFHGIYQQDDRDARQASKARTGEKAYSMMVRLRLPGGQLTPEQYLIQDAVAEKFGNGTLRFTTRQSIQFHGILKGNLRAAIQEINSSLVSTISACGDVNRNVMACPAPAQNRAQAHIQEFAEQIARHLAPRSRAYYDVWIDGEQVELEQFQPEEEPIYGPTYLPRKFKIAVAYPGDNCIDVYTQDIALIASIEDEQLQGFTLIIGGGMGATHGKKTTYPRLGDPLCFVTPDQVLKVVETIVTIQRDYGDRTNRKHARMKYVVEEKGIAWFRAELEQRLGYAVRDPLPVTWNTCLDDHLGWHEQGDGRWYVGVSIENGRVKGQIRTGLRNIIDTYRPDVRLTAQQNIILYNIQAEQRAEIEQALASYGIITDPQQLGAHRYALACVSLPTCGLALAEAERVLPSVVDQIDHDLRELGMEDELQRLSIRMTGCPNGCARPYMGDIGFVGRSKDLYNIHLGGDLANTRLNTLYASTVKLGELASTLKPIFLIWKEERQAGEQFGDFCHRVGFDHLRSQVSVQTPV